MKIKYQIYETNDTKIMNIESKGSKQIENFEYINTFYSKITLF